MTDTKPYRTFTIHDPQLFDGDAYQVAERAIQQMNGVIALALELMRPTVLMVRNADLDRALAAGIPLDEIAPGWEKSPQGRKLAEVRHQLEALQKTLGVLQKAAAYDPKGR